MFLVSEIIIDGHHDCNRITGLFKLALIFAMRSLLGSRMAPAGKLEGEKACFENTDIYAWNNLFDIDFIIKYTCTIFC